MLLPPLKAFDKNPFFQNKQLWKEVKYEGESDDLEPKVVNSPINWNKGKNPAELKKGKTESKETKGKRTIEDVEDEDEDEISFFEWFSSTEPDTVHLGEWLRDKFYPNAIKYYFGDISDDDDELGDFMEDDEDDDLDDSDEEGGAAKEDGDGDE